MKHHQLRALIVDPVLRHLDLYSPSAEELLVLTAAVESQGGEYIRQVSGPARGIYQMEPATFNYLCDWLSKHPKMDKLVSELELPNWYPTHNWDELEGNLYFSTALCRLRYYVIPHPLPDANDLVGLAKYYKEYYNTPMGAATVNGAIAAYKKFIAN